MDLLPSWPATHASHNFKTLRAALEGEGPPEPRLRSGASPHASISSARKEERTKGPDATCRKPRASAFAFHASKASGVT